LKNQYIKCLLTNLSSNLKIKDKFSIFHIFQICNFDTDIGTEELGHLEMICAIVHQLTQDLTIDEIKQQGFADYYVDHTLGIYPVSASGVPYSAGAFQSKGDTITDLVENLAAEQKARTVYDNILRLTDDDDVRQPIKFLRAREIVHFQRFGEANRSFESELYFPDNLYRVFRHQDFFY